MFLKLRWLLTSALFFILLSGCTAIPEGIEPVTGFDGQRYMGKWYEIARLDHSFERGLTQVSANYTAEDNKITVLNTGYSAADNKWKEAEGKAFFVGDKTTGHLKVSFFGPFYSSYIVFYLDKDYQHSLVTGYNKDYFWILSRDKTLTEKKYNELVAIAKAKGFAVDKLIRVKQN